MAVVRPFKAVRPTPALAEKVAALPYDVMNSEEARRMVVGNPYSFLHVDKAEVDLDPSVDLYDVKVYEKARDNLRQMIADGVFTQDSEACLYIYKQVMDGRTQIGIVGCTAVDDYRNNIIKKHELTRADKEQDRINHVDYCDANTGPIFLTYRAKAAINQMVTKVMEKDAPVYDFVSEDGIGHTVWVIGEASMTQAICKEFADVDYLYIADGHHRSASAVRVGMMRRDGKPDYDGSEYKVSIAAKDASAPYDYDLTTRLVNYAKKAGCDYAVDVFYRYGTDGTAALRAGNNLRAAAVGMAVYCSHGMERTHVEGLRNTMNLLLAYVLDI